MRGEGREPRRSGGNSTSACEAGDCLRDADVLARSLVSLALAAGHRFHPAAGAAPRSQRRASLGSRRGRSRGLLKQPLSAEGPLRPRGLQPAASLGAAARALGSCLALAEIVVEFADSARRELNTCSQVVRPISTAVGYEKHARAFICNNRALLKYCKLKIFRVILSNSTSLLSL